MDTLDFKTQHEHVLKLPQELFEEANRTYPETDQF